jgi:hypothetical protein
MALDEKTCWNLTWTTIDNVVSRVLGAFFHAHLFEVKAHYNDHYGYDTYFPGYNIVWNSNAWEL